MGTQERLGVNIHVDQVYSTEKYNKTDLFL